MPPQEPDIYDSANLPENDDEQAINGHDAASPPSVPVQPESLASAALSNTETPDALNNLFAGNPGYNLDMIQGGPLTPEDTPDDHQQPRSADIGITEPSLGPQRTKRAGTSRLNMLMRGGACESCKRRKLKCTAEQPSCLACRRADRECVYSQTKQRSRVKILEDKVAELESQLAERQDHQTYHPPVAVIPELVLGLGDEMILAEAETLTPGMAKRAEPDLMTLADAAAADTAVERPPWEGMDPQSIASEMVKAVCENSKGVGEKICAHLLHVFAHPTQFRLVHCLVSPSFLWHRLSGQGDSMPHPALLAALMPNLLAGSPSPSLSAQVTIAAATDALVGPSRMLAQHALATIDHRVLDLVAAATLRSLALMSQGRFIDAWSENSAACALLWATGLGKLGGVGERFAPEKLQRDRAARVEYERRGRLIRQKGQIVAPPSSAQDVTERIRLFWSVFMNDRGNAIGWNYPCAIDASEITTPLPKDNYDDPASLCDNTSINDFLSGRVISSPDEGVFCTSVKAMALVYEAVRLLDKSPEVATPDKTGHLLRLTKRWMASLPAYEPRSREEAIEKASRNEAWMSGYVTLLLLYSKEEIDAPSKDEENDARGKAIDAGLKMCECVQQAYDKGDVELDGYDLTASMLWYICGRSFHHLARRIESDNPMVAAELREKVAICIAATRKLTDNRGMADVHAQMMYNVSLDCEVMVGEYLRPDNVDF